MSPADKNPTSGFGLQGERKFITVLFTDVVNYTSLARNLDVEVLREIMNDHFKAIIEPVNKYEGTVDQLLGDGMVAFFGAPLAYEDHAQRACYAALAMQETTTKYAESIRREYRIDFKIRIGINSGLVLVGPVGTSLHTEYIAVGDAVNLASRLQNAALPGSVLVSPNTYNLARDFFEFSGPSSVQVKGQEEPVFAYRLAQARPAEHRFEAAATRGLSPFVGRGEELGILNEALARAKTGRPQTVGIVGEPGIGKSRLLREFKESLKAGEYICLEGQCLHYGNAAPYLPLVDILNSFFGIQPEDSGSQARDKIIQAVESVDKRLLDDLSFIHEVLSINVEDEAFFSIGPQDRRNKLFETVTRLLIRASALKPVIIAIEDLHWIDGPSEEFLDYFLRVPADRRILLLLLFRPEYRPPWQARSDYSLVHVGQLSAADTAGLLTSMLPDGGLAADLKELVQTKTGGNPLFIEEFVRALMDKKIITRNNWQYELNASSASLQLPDTLQGIIASRIDRLPEPLKSTLQTAAVIGRDFDYNTLLHVRQAPQLETHLRNLEELEFLIRTRPHPQAVYSFKHALVQDVAYGTLLVKTRKGLHENVARAIEGLYPTKLEEYIDALAYHYWNGQSVEKALDYNIQAGNKARKMYANGEAITSYSRALELCPKFGEQGDGIAARLHEDLADIYIITAKPDQASQSDEASYRLNCRYQESLNHPGTNTAAIPENLRTYLPAAMSKNCLLARLYYRKTRICQMTTRYDEAHKWADEGLALTDVPDIERARLLASKTFTLFRLCEYEAAIRCGQEALEFVGKVGNDIFEAQAYAAQGATYRTIGNTQLSAWCYQRALEVFVRLKDLHGQSGMLNNLGNAYSEEGEWEKSEECYKQCMEIARRIGAVNRIGSASCNLADQLRRQGRIEEAIVLLDNALEVTRPTGDRNVMNVAYNNLCQCYIKLGEWRKAQDYVQKALKEIEHTPIKNRLAECHVNLAEIHFGLGETGVALEYCGQALDVFIRIRLSEDEAWARQLMGRIYHRMTSWDQAEKELSESSDIFERIRSLDHMAASKWYLAVLYHDMNKSGIRDIPHQTVRNLATRATSIFNKLHIAYDEALAHQLLQE